MLKSVLYLKFLTLKSVLYLIKNKNNIVEYYKNILIILISFKM